MADLENATSFRFADSGEWELEVKRANARTHDSPKESVVITEDCDGHVEWHDVRGTDRKVADRRQVEGIVKLVKNHPAPKQGPMKGLPLGEYVPIGDEAALVAVFDCHGCEPIELLSTRSPIWVEQEDSDFQKRVVHVPDFEGGWAGPDDMKVLFTHHEFRRM